MPRGVTEDMDTSIARSTQWVIRSEAPTSCGQDRGNVHRLSGSG
jgi:hypothetical protein